MSCLTQLTRFGRASLCFPLLLGMLLLFPAAHADVAVLVDQGTLVEIDPPDTVVPEPDNPDDPQETPETGGQPVGTARDASYVSQAGFAVTGSSFIDAATYVFDLANTESVTAATLKIPVREVFPQNGAAPVQVTFSPMKMASSKSLTTALVSIRPLLWSMPPN